MKEARRYCSSVQPLALGLCPKERGASLCFYMEHGPKESEGRTGLSFHLQGMNHSCRFPGRLENEALSWRAHSSVSVTEPSSDILADTWHPSGCQSGRTNGTCFWNPCKHLWGCSESWADSVCVYLGTKMLQQDRTINQEIFAWYHFSNSIYAHK